MEFVRVRTDEGEGAEGFGEGEEGRNTEVVLAVDNDQRPFQDHTITDFQAVLTIVVCTNEFYKNTSFINPHA